MNWKILMGTMTLLAALGIGVLAGSLLSPSASAGVNTRTDLAGLAAQATITPAPNNQQPAPPAEGPRGPRGRGFDGRGGGPGFGPGFGGDHGGRFGGMYTADGATRAISSTTSIIALVKSDLAYATGKMDTATVQDWLNKADALLRTAQTANTAGEYGKAVETANAAHELAAAGEITMQQALGADKLPSYGQRPFPGEGHKGPGPMPGMPTPANITQAQASRALAGFYNGILVQEALLNNSVSKGDAATYLAAAKAQYGKAYTAYQAANYTEAVNTANVGHVLLRVVDSLLRAGTAPNSPDIPVRVPPPFV